MVTVEKFEGPITSLALAEWLSRCEDSFESWDDDNEGNSLTNKQKIHAAGTSNVKTTTTDQLHSWWTMNRTKLDGWRLRSLRDLYTASQGAQTLDEYFATLDNFKFVLSRASLIPEISEFDLNNDVRDSTFLNDGVEDVKDYLMKYQTGDAASSSSIYALTTLSELAASGMFIHSSAWGTDLGTRFSNTTASTFPSTSKQIQHLNRLTIFTNNETNNRLIQGFDTQFNNSQTTRGPPSIYDGYVSHIIDLAADEVINQVQLSRRTDLYVISSVEVTTSKGRILVAGAVSGDKQVFKAPLGWRIIGFHGASYTSAVYLVGANRYPIPRLGFICAPLV
ncbi:hypothetical protein BDV12DRAFT_200339 [Aspergillus spectabilis]